MVNLYSAKLTVITDLKRIMDYQAATEQYFIDRFYNKVFFTPEGDDRAGQERYQRRCHQAGERR